jgi:hypothetical protein
MLGSTILEVFIGLILVFLLVSVICTSVREGIESFRRTRAAYLERGIRELLDDRNGDKLAKAIYEHPVISGLYSGKYESGSKEISPGLMEAGNELPSYIPSGNFAVALMDLIARGPVEGATTAPDAPGISVETIKENVRRIGNPNIERVILTAVDFAKGDINKLQLELEGWFNSGMNRVSGWYKRSTQKIVFIIALFVVVGLNVNTITIANYLSKNETARKMLVEQAVSVSKDSNYIKQGYQEARADLNELNIPIGWSHGFASAYVDGPKSDGLWSTGIGPLLGWLVTAIAAMLGAPFWFDMLNKFIVVRSTVKPNEKSPNEASKDSQQKVFVVATPASGNEPTQAGATNTGDDAVNQQPPNDV